MKKVCSFDGCNHKARMRGLCDTHYQRHLRAGTLDKLPRVRAESGKGTVNHGYHLVQHGGIRRLTHVLVAGKALGKTLPNGSVVHHVNENKLDNRNENLVICPNRAYHLLIHQRMRALESCGHADWRKCNYCHQYDAIENLVIKKHGGVYHRKCNAENESRRRACQTRK